MNTSQTHWTAATGWRSAKPEPVAPQLVFVFGATAALKNPAPLAELQRRFKGAEFFGCSTAGEICGTAVTDDSIVATAVQFEHAGLHLAQVDLAGPEASFTAGEQVCRMLPAALSLAGREEKLSHVIVLSDGLKANGSELLAGMTAALPPGVVVTGGLAGDGARFTETLVVWDGVARAGAVVALGLYGAGLRVGYGAFGGWDPFGPERKITKARGNVLFELDGQSALALYKKYLGDQAKDLPGSGLLFPLSLRFGDERSGVVRTILAVDEAAQSMTFAGDVPEGAYARLMKANFDRLIDGAGTAASSSGAQSPELALLISCVGRKLVLQQRIEEEVEAVREVLGPGTALTGFYSYGEISPFGAGGQCELHNQTMTIIHLSEK
jgi:hypothetical protein